MSEQIERRDFLKTSLTASATIGVANETNAAPAIATESNATLGAKDQNRVGVIGGGGQGNWDANDFARQPNVRLVALCDVYEGSIQETLVTDSSAAQKPITHSSRVK